MTLLSRVEAPEYAALREEVADAIAESKISYSMTLTRLVDGVATYRLSYYDGALTIDFMDTDEQTAQNAAYEHIAETKRYAAADAALAVLRAKEGT
jgi:hypothetical protein